MFQKLILQLFWHLFHAFNTVLLIFLQLDGLSVNLNVVLLIVLDVIQNLVKFLKMTERLTGLHAVDSELLGSEEGVRQEGRNLLKTDARLLKLLLTVQQSFNIIRQLHLLNLLLLGRLFFGLWKHYLFFLYLVNGYLYVLDVFHQ